MNRFSPDLDTWRQDLKARLGRATADPRHPWRWPVLTTVDVDGPDARTVVLRRRTERALEAHTDVDAAKVDQLRDDPRASWLFLDRHAKLQLRITSRVRVHHLDTVAEAAWSQVSGSRREAYGHEPVPGTCIDHPDAWQVHPRLERFAVLVAEMTAFEALWLRRDGHWRARWRWMDGRWDGSWLVP